ncbi:MAC/perforin domain-containing protein [Sunxiuqinia elliptica]|uniref:MAC/Perforin domain-containing protein n=1 Tax=Sunxiuqinia elliptica TaxID=655355 RepID=A0A1I2IUF1_9BACT|nr:MAC/perforin domain-containing protein [Sunxiuqinia elliptica]SFF44386.1 MAC/Perforin domain-containing protein [Sunxiuqinia elliptica]
MKKITLFILLFCIAFFGCEEDSINPIAENNDELIIIKERNSKYPLILSQKSSPKLKNSSVLSFDDYLGRSYKANTIPFGYAENVGYPVIDMKKLLDAHPTYKTHLGINTTNVNAFSFANFERYVDNSTIKGKLSGGGSINLGILNIGAKNKFEDTYTKNKIAESDRVHGQIDIEFRSDLYQLQTSSNISKKIMENYLSPDFKDDLYNTTPVEIFNNYGAFVLRRFITGGRATALYSARHTKNESTISNEFDMDANINASFKLGKIDGKADVGLGFGYTNNNYELQNIKDFQMSISTVGGKKVYSQLSPPIDVKQANVDLSPWMNSLDDKISHAVIDIADDGLIPLWDFILEKNIKKQLKARCANEILHSQLSEPYIIAVKSKDQSNPQTLVLLRTRFNDLMILDVIPPSESLENNISNNKYFDILTVSPTSTDELSRHTFFTNSMSTETNFVRFNWNNFKKYTDPEGVVYLLDTASSVGFTLHYKWLSGTYGITDIINKMNTITVERRDLYNYTLIAL